MVSLNLPNSKIELTLLSEYCQAMQNKDRPYTSALKVNPGVAQPSSINQNAINKYLNRKIKPLTPEGFLRGIRAGDRTLLSKAITLIESPLPEHQSIAQELITLLPYACPIPATPFVLA